MRVTPNTVLGLRAVFGFLFVALGAVTLWHVLVAPAPLASKAIGGVLALGMIVLGGVRVGMYVRTRKSSG